MLAPAELLVGGATPLDALFQHRYCTVNIYGSSIVMLNAAARQVMHHNVVIITKRSSKIAPKSHDNYLLHSMDPKINSAMLKCSDF